MAFLALTSVSITASGAISKESATAVINMAAAKLKSAKGISANFTLGTSDGSLTGKIIMSGNKFTIQAPTMKVWYDGKTQWSYAVRNKEVNISEPTTEEISQINPYVIINNIGSNYNARTLSSKGSTKRIELTSKNARNDIKTATVSVDSRGYPVAIQMTLRSGSKVNISISNVVELSNAPSLQTFRFENKMAQGAEIIDLR